MLTRKSVKIRRNLAVFAMLTMLLKNRYAHGQSFPAYWEGKMSTFDNSTTDQKIPFILSGKVVSYETINNTKGKDKVNSLLSQQNDPNRAVLPQQYLPNNKIPENVTAHVRKVTFRNAIVTFLELLQKYDADGSGIVPVRLSTSWYDIDESQSVDHTNGYLSEAIANGNIFNISMEYEYNILIEKETKEYNENRKHEIFNYLCYYEGYITEMINGKCYIPFTALIEVYKTMWNPDAIFPPALNGVIRPATNNPRISNLSTWCIDNTQKLVDIVKLIVKGDYKYLCSVVRASYRDAILVDPDDAFLKEDLVYYQFDSKPVGIGYVTNITYGQNRTLQISDLNFTIAFSNWTVDFPTGFLESYRDAAYKYNKFKLVIHYWNEIPQPPPPRPVPDSFWIIVIILAVPITVIGMALIIWSCTCSSKSFTITIWEYKVKRHQYKRLAREKEERRLAEIKEMELERQYVYYQQNYEKQLQEMEEIEREQQEIERLTTERAERHLEGGYPNQGFNHDENVILIM